MDPNSQHQRWSFWQYRVYPDQTHRPDFATVKTNCGRFGRLAFGSASAMRVLEATDAHGRLYWEVSVRTEGHPVQDPLYSEWMHMQWQKFFQNGFGASAEIHCHARLEAGTRDDGSAADQLIILPGLPVSTQL